MQPREDLILNSLVLVRSLVLSVCFVQSLQTNTRSGSGNGEIQIHFTGNKVFSDDQLLGAMHWAVQPSLNRSTGLGIDCDEVKKGADRICEFMVDRDISSRKWAIRG